MTGNKMTLVVAVGLTGLFGALLAVFLLIGAGQFVVQASENDTGTVGAGGALKDGAVPPEYAELITRAAETCPEITPGLLAAQVQQESGFDPSATSPVGAVGIAQFMPATWSSVGQDYSGDGRADPRDPADAIPGQARYMCDQIEQVRGADLDGDLVDLALAAYNAGFGAVRSHGGIPPYEETQNYVRTIRSTAAELSEPAPHAAPTPAGGWTTPADGSCSSGFGSRWGSFHKGQDIANEVGTPIVAASSGTVIASGPASGYGLWVKIEHPDGVVTIYGHNNRNTVDVGQQVTAGEPIAEIGNRGESTGPHLHYQVEVDGQAVDPVSFHQSQGAPPLCG